MPEPHQPQTGDKIPFFGNDEGGLLPKLDPDILKGLEQNESKREWYA